MAAEIAADVANRSAPDNLVTVPVVRLLSRVTTASDTTPSPPRTTMRSGRSLVSSVTTAPGTVVGATRSIGAPEDAAAGAPDRASGNAIPFAT